MAEALAAEPLAPLYVQVGTAGCEWFFEHSAESIYALTLAYPHLSFRLRKRVRDHLGREFKDRPPWRPDSRYEFRQGNRRERFMLPPNIFRRGLKEHDPHPIAYLYPTWLYSATFSQWEQLEAAWPELQRTFERFVRTLPLQSARERQFSNAYIAGLIGFARLAKHYGRNELADQAAGLAARLAEELVKRYRADVTRLTYRRIENVRQIDSLLRDGDGLFLVTAGHKAKPAKLMYLTPPLAQALRRYASKAAQSYLSYVRRTMPAWYLVGEERQVHTGENLMHYPNFSLALFKGNVLLDDPSPEDVDRWTDMAWCVGDWTYVEKLVWAIRYLQQQHAQRTGSGKLPVEAMRRQE
ncbi:MAG TPA: hypothetical protein EYP14_03795 [Planctomycetaceae bacterium]|nr:hypothetical protein [Planctomycetaceae bacterium]